MKRETKKYLCGIAVLAGLFVIGSLMQSRESQANGAYSTPVTVMNTTANPGSVLDASTASRVPYQSVLIKDCGSGVSQCQFIFPAPPTGFRLVVENVSGAANVVSGSAPPTVALQSIPSLNGIWAFTATVGQTLNFVNSGFNQTVRAYFETASEQPQVGVGANFSSSFQTVVTLSGYLENCAVVGCPAIQH
jgi:hypothetical protein